MYAAHLDSFCIIFILYTGAYTMNRIALCILTQTWLIITLTRTIKCGSPREKGPYAPWCATLETGFYATREQIRHSHSLISAFVACLRIH